MCRENLDKVDLDCSQQSIPPGLQIRLFSFKNVFPAIICDKLAPSKFELTKRHALTLTYASH
jgi:hypothetical protein